RDPPVTRGARRPPAVRRGLVGAAPAADRRLAPRPRVGITTPPGPFLATSTSMSARQLAANAAQMAVPVASHEQEEHRQRGHEPGRAERAGRDVAAGAVGLAGAEVLP